MAARATQLAPDRYSGTRRAAHCPLSSLRRAHGQYLDNLRDGVRDGRTAPTIATQRVIAQLHALLEPSPGDSPMAAPAKFQPADLAEGLTRSIAESVYPAFRRMLEFLEDYLTRHARQDPGVWAVADGQEIYALLVRQHTTTELTPDELHQIGLDDLASIHQEMRAIMARRGLPKRRSAPSPRG